MKNRLLNDCRITPVNVFMWGLIALVLLTAVQLPLNQGQVFFSLLHSDHNDTFMDFFNSVSDACASNPYTERGIIYPPLTQLYYRACSLLLPKMYARDVRASQYGLFMMPAIMALTFWFLYKALMPNGKENDRNVKRMVLWIIFGTVPFWYAVERANIILLTLAFLAYFLQNYQSENAVKRELALVSLAVAVAFKIYPVFFGILLIMNKQYKEAVRCVLYGIILFFLPFAFFGGLSSFKVLIENIIGTSAKMANNGWGYKLNIDNTLGFLGEAFHVPVVGAGVIKILLALVVVGSLFFSKKEWQKTMVLSAAMIIFPGFSYAYTMIFAAVPLIMFLAGEPKVTTRNLMFSLLFLGMFAPFPLGGKVLFDAAPQQYYMLNLTTAVSSLSLLAMLLMIGWDVIDCRIGKRTPDPEKKKVYGGLEVNPAVMRFVVAVALISVVAIVSYLCCQLLYIFLG